MTELEILRNTVKEHEDLLRDYFKLQKAARTLYYSAYWRSDRLPIHIEATMWEDLKEAAFCLNKGPVEIFL